MRNHINISLIAVVSLFLLSCGTNTQPKQAETRETLPTIEEPKIKYNNVREMIEGMNDYYEEAGTFKVISDEPLHIQVSPEVVEGDQGKVIRQLTIRTLVYVSYSTFARTDIDEITITSIPLQINMSDRRQPGKYLDQNQITQKISRTKAQKVMQQHIGTNNFDDLLGAEMDGKFYKWRNSAKFDQLKSLNDDFVVSVYQDLLN
jgi:hypothetical protein